MSVRTEKDISQAAELILQVWNDPQRAVLDLPNQVRPENLAHAYGIQQAVSRGLGAVGGWIVRESTRLGIVISAPLPLSSIHLNGVHLSNDNWTYRHLTPCLCFRMAGSLPEYRAPYSRDQIIAAIESCHAAVAIQQPRLAATDELDPLAALADSDGYGCLVYNPRGLPLREIDLTRLKVRTIVGNKEIQVSPAEPGFDTIGALHLLANDGSRWAGGLMVGHLVAAPISAGEMQVPPEVAIRTLFDDIGSVDLRFGGDRKSSRNRYCWNFWRKAPQTSMAI